MITGEPTQGVVRTPITGLRSPIVTQEPLEWNYVYESFVNLIKFASKQVAEKYQTSATCTAEDLFQEGQLILFHCFEMYKYKDKQEFSVLFKSSLWRGLRNIASDDVAKASQINQVDISEAYDIGYSEEVVHEIYQEYKLQQVVELLSSNELALTVLREMLNPSKRTIWEAEMDIARKNMLKSQKSKGNIPQTIRGVHIQRAMEIPQSTYKETVQVIKDVFVKVYELTEKGESLEGSEDIEALRNFVVAS